MQRLSVVQRVVVQDELGPMIEEVMAKWEKTWSNRSFWGVLHESDYVK